MRRILLCGCLLLGVASCRSGGAKSATSQRPDPPARGELRDRAQQYWQARVDQNWDRLYEFLEPWQRESGPVSEYAAWAKENEPFNIVAFRILEVQQEPPYGWVRISYDSTLRAHPGSAPRTAEVDQKWTAERGDWFPVAAESAESCPIPPDQRDRQAEQDLARRFKESWDARRARDWTRLYAMTDPRDRKDVSEAEYGETEGLFDYLSHNLKWVEVVGDKGKVRVVYHHKVTDPNLTKLPPRDAELTENWVKVENEWYRNLK